MANRPSVDGRQLASIQKQVEAVPPERLKAEIRKNVAILQARPGDPALNFAVGLMLSRAGDQDQALKQLDKALKLTRDNDVILGTLAFVHANRLGDHKTAIRYLEKKLKLNPRDPAGPLLMANSHMELGKPERALQALAKLKGPLPPTLQSRLHAMRAQCHQRMGQFEEARRELLRLAQIEPGGMIAVADILSRLPGNPDTLQDQLACEMEEALENRPEVFRNGFHRGSTAISLGNILEERGACDEAFPWFEKANQFQGRDENSWSWEETREFDILKGVFTADIFEKIPQGHPSNKQIFVVGMPRSGTTLLESILGAHPSIEDHGELEFFVQQQHLIGITGVRNPEVGERISAIRREICAAPADGFKGIGDAYLRQHGFDRRPSMWKVDKMPHNFRALGLIAATFPNARIIHARRHPMDTCLSNFKTLLPGYNTTFGQDLETLGRFYLEYASLMRWWREVLPVDILDVRYENMVTDPETGARALIAFAGPDWDPACLTKRGAKQDVNTASMWQVRQDIYTSSVQKWRRYEKQLQPLADMLSEEIARYERGE